MQALLKHDDAGFDFPRIVQSLVQSLSDHSRVITAAIEALAVVHHIIGDQIQGLLVASGASVSSRLMLAARFASNELPAMDKQGALEREVGLDSAHILIYMCMQGMFAPLQINCHTHGDRVGCTVLLLQSTHTHSHGQVAFSWSLCGHQNHTCSQM